MLFAACVTVLLGLAVCRGALGPGEACWNTQLYEMNKSCAGPEAYLIFNHDQAIFQVDTDGGNEWMLMHTGTLVLLDFDYTDGRLYWVSTDSGLIHTSFLNGTHRQKLHSAGKGISGFAVDWIQKHLIWANQEKGTMERVGSNGENPRIILTDLSQPGSIAIDPNDRFIFWVSDGITPSIQRSNLEGERTSTVLKTSDRLGAISLDFSDKRLFWVQINFEHRSTIGSCDYNGNLVNIIKTSPLAQPWGISVFLEHVYFTDNNTKTIKRQNKYTGDEEETITHKYPLHPPIDLRVVHPMRQPTAEGQPIILTDVGCDGQTGTCRTVCSHDTDTGMCHCSQGFTLSKHGDRCEDVNECALWNHGCTLGCENLPGSYVCTCPVGYLLLPDMKTCHEHVVCTDNATLCDHNCVHTEEGDICVCPSGTILEPSKEKCTGCLSWDNGGCSQLCVPLSLTQWECECLPGYQIHPDGKRCMATGVAPYLLLANIIDIQRINMDGTGDQSLLQEPRGAVLALDYDPVEGKVYFASTALKQIERANLDGSGREVLVSEELDLPEGMAVDWVNRLLYWTDQGLSTIERSDLTGLNRETVIRQGLQKPRGIAVHPVAKKLFWTDMGERPAVESTSLDGSDRTIIAAAGLMAPTGLAIDYTLDRLYWCDSKRGVVEVAELDGSNRRIVTENEVGQPFHITVFEDLVWITDWDHYLILKIDKWTGKNLGYLHGNMAHPASLVVVHPLAKPVASGGKVSPETVPLKSSTLSDEGVPSGSTLTPLFAAQEGLEQMVSDQNDCFSMQCEKNAQCLGAGDSATCQCLEGFREEGSLCVDIDECKFGMHNCDWKNGLCWNTVGSYLCRCAAGYSGTGFNCQAEPIHTLAPASSASPPDVTTQWQNNMMERCPPSHDAYCLYEGVCFYFPEMESYGCNCVRGHMGERCQYSDLEWKELQQAEQASRRCHLAIAVCIMVLFILLFLGMYIIICHRSRQFFRKCPPSDDMSDTSTSEEDITTETSSTIAMVGETLVAAEMGTLLSDSRDMLSPFIQGSEEASRSPDHLRTINDLSLQGEP